MNPIVQSSPAAGRLVRFDVPGSVSSKPNPENEVDLVEGEERSAFVYVPVSGCPHPKQTQVVYVLRGDATRESAEDALSFLGLAGLAEREHFVVVLPNPLEEGWNFAREPSHDDDSGFLARCFASLKAATGVSGFNGMMFHIACTPEASAMVWTLARVSPLDAAAIMIGRFPVGYTAPEGDGAEQVAWLYETNGEASSVLAGVDGPCRDESVAGGAVCHMNVDNPNVRYFEDARGLSADEVADAWSSMFAGTRRWRNDIHGIYQPRPDFEALGFEPHVDDSSLDLSDGIARTWFEYVPKRLRGTSEPIPLVLYFHGINCCGLYGAEQSGWAEIADRDGFMCVFPDATAEMRWNAWGDDRIPTDVDFVMALIERMAAVHPLDRSRIYISGFSMGSMFTNALAYAYPEVFAGAVAFNGPHMVLESTLEESAPGMLLYNPKSAIRNIEHRDEDKSPVRLLAESKREGQSWRMPFVQSVGLLDDVGFERGKLFPVTAPEDSSWYATVAYWKEQSGIAVDPMLSTDTESGFFSDCAEHEGRFIHQSWNDAEGDEGLYHLIGVARMPHAVDLSGVEMGWEIIKHFRRNEDGSLETID